MADLGAHRLRDLAAPERLWQVVHHGLRYHFPPVRSVDASSNNLPVQRTSLIGREVDIQRVTELIARHRIVTLTGVGGVGKTRLAVHAAADLLSRFTDVWFVELASVADPDGVAGAIAVAAGAAGVADPLSAAAALLGGHRTLLVVDNCEHVIDGAASVVDALTARCPDLSVIATSREPLDVDGEHVVGVVALDPATAAVELFEQRAAAAGADLGLVDRSSIADLCRRLDGIPLAIELAASRTSTLGVATILGALDDRWALLSRAGRRVGPALRRWAPRSSGRTGCSSPTSSGCSGGSPSSRAASSSTPPCTSRRRSASTPATERVASLVHKSMVSLEASGTRYRMLETMRAFALDQLAAQGEQIAALTALARWMATITDLPADDPCNAAVERSSIRLEREADNWREAVALALRLRSAELAAALCGPPVAFFLLGRHDLAEVVRPLLDVCADDARRRRAMLCALIVSAAGSTEPEQLQAWAEELQADRRGRTDWVGRPDGLDGVGVER